MMPPAPGSELVIGHPGLTFSIFNSALHPESTMRHLRESLKRRFRRRIGELVLDVTCRFITPNDEPRFWTWQLITDRVHPYRPHLHPEGAALGFPDEDPLSFECIQRWTQVSNLNRSRLIFSHFWLFGNRSSIAFSLSRGAFQRLGSRAKRGYHKEYRRYRFDFHFRGFVATRVVVHNGNQIQ